jgi:hypothetical protein
MLRGSQGMGACCPASQAMPPSCTSSTYSSNSRSSSSRSQSCSNKGCKQPHRSQSSRRREGPAALSRSTVSQAAAAARGPHAPAADWAASQALSRCCHNAYQARVPRLQLVPLLTDAVVLHQSVPAASQAGWSPHCTDPLLPALPTQAPPASPPR